MGRTRITIPSSGDIEMYDDVSTPLTFNIADIRNPEKRNSNFSKTIKIPGTKVNNLLFGNIFDVNITTGAFNPNSKVRAHLIIDDEEQLVGYIQLLNIIINDDNKIEYEVSISGNVGNIFNALGNAELTDLDFSAQNHTYDYATQIASWSNTYSSGGYVYPMIDYGFDSNPAVYDVENMLPALFVRSYIDKMFASVGYTYTSTFFDSAFFKNLIIPSNIAKLMLTDTLIAPKLFEATESVESNSTWDALGNEVSEFPIIYNTEVSDPTGQYNPVTGRFTAATNGYFSFAANGAVQSNSVPPLLPADDYLTTIWLQKSVDGGSTWTNIAVESYYSTVTTNPYVGVTNILLNTGNIIRVMCKFNNSSGGYTGTMGLNGGTFKNSVPLTGVLEGGTCDVSQCVPQKIKQKDFLKSIISLFNLYVDVDKNNDKNLLIETRDQFYSDGTNLDWSAKLDNSKQIEYRPLGDLDFRDIIHTYTDDADYFNKKYKDSYQETYGYHKYTTENEFLSGTNETKVIFSPTPLVGDNASNRVVPRIWNYESGVVSPKQFNIRILYLGGTKTSNVTYNYTGRFSGNHYLTQYLYAGHLDDTANPTLDLSFGVPREIYYNAATYTDNNLFNAYYRKFVEEISDRDSKIVTAYFYLRPSDIRNLDFRNQFWFENEYFRLNKIYDYDPLKHETTKCEFIKIKDAGTFTPTIHTMIGGLSSAFGEAFEIPPISTNPSWDTANNVIVSGGARAMVGGEDNIFNDNLREFINLGDGNIIGDSRNVTLLGSSGDIIGSGSSNITLIDSSGDIIGNNLKNVTLFNTSNVTVSSGDILMMNNMVIPSITPPYAPIKSVSGTSYNVQVFDGTILVTTGATDTTINLTFSLQRFLQQWQQFNYYTATITQNFTKIFNIKKIDSGAGKVIIDPSGSATIDGSTTKELTMQYDCITIQYDGTNWHII